MKTFLMLLFVMVTSSISAFTETWQHIRDCVPVAKNQYVTQPLKIDINSADKKSLMQLKGIGSKKAQAIIDYRTTHGDIRSSSDLLKIKGFTKKTLPKFLKENEDKLEDF